MSRRTLTFAAIGAGIAATGAIVWAFGPGAAGLVEWLADGREVWRLGRLHVEGVRGPHIAALEARRFTLADEDGVWAEARGVRARWSPFSLLFGDVDVTEVSAAEIDVLRRPVLSAPKPPGFFRPDVTIRSMRVARIHLAEPVVHREATLRFDGVVSMGNRALETLTLNFARVDADTDRLSLRINPGPDELLTAFAEGDPGGVIASALEAPTQAVRMQARARGDEDAGEAILRATIGEQSLAGGDASWSAQDWRAALQFQTARAPVFLELTKRFGPVLSAQAQGARREGRARPFRIDARADNLTLRGDGRLTNEWRLDGALRLAIATPAIKRLIPEFDLQGAGASIEADATFPNGGAAFVGRARLARIGLGDVRADMAGPFSASWGARTIAANVEFDLTPRGDTATQRLLAGGRLAGRVRYNRRAERVEIERAALMSRALRIDAEGRVDDEAGAFDGRWRMLNLAAASPRISGAAEGSWRATRAQDQPWRILADGVAQGFRAREATIAQLLGRAPRMNFDGSLAKGGVRVQRATIEGVKLRAGATGLYADALDLNVEASARGPIRLGGAEIAGTIDATGRLTGPRARPRLNAEARMRRFDMAGVAIEQPVLNVVYDLGARSGEATLNGSVSGQLARANAIVRAERNALMLSNLTASAIGIDASGEASFGAIGPAFNLTFSGGLSGLSADAAGQIQGHARLTPTRGAPSYLDLQGQARQAAFGDIRFSQASLAVQGPVDSLNANARVSGMSGETPIVMDANGRIVSDRGRTLGTFNLRGDLGGEALATSAPARIEIVNGRVDAQASLIAGDGGAELTWRRDGDSFTASARFDRAELAPLAALAGNRAEGTLSGEARLASVGDGLSGAANLTIDAARLPARMRAPLDMRIDARLDPSRITGAVNATSRDGLEARLEGSAPVSTNARALRIALAPAGEGRASWRAHGPADALWGLVGGLDQSLGGQVSGQGQIRFTTRTLRGEGALALAGGNFEDKRAGVSLQNVDARLQFTEAGASQFTISAQDAHGGRLTGTGEARGVGDGRIALTLARMRLLDREDMRATGSGNVNFIWTREGATLSGAIALDNAELMLARRSDAVVPEIEVVEINRPGGDLPPLRPREPGPRAVLDLRLTAPGRLYTRGRGLDAEWSLDARVQGTSDAPLLYGEARLVRGEFTLAGRPFELERGLITLAGPLAETRIDLLAERSEPELTARVAITDQLFDPTITLSSDPALPEDEILPHILFGSSMEDLSALQGAQMAASLTELTGRSAFDIAGMARAAIGLQRLDIRQEEGGVAVAGGRYLTRDVYFEVSRTGLGEPGAKVEWRVRRQLSLVTSFLGNGDQRVSVRWRRDY